MNAIQMNRDGEKEKGAPDAREGARDSAAPGSARGTVRFAEVAAAEAAATVVLAAAFASADPGRPIDPRQSRGLNRRRAPSRAPAIAGRGWPKAG